jgi:WD40 repeat protein
MHKFPIQKLRLSKKQARFLVTCGAKQDVLLKLWNVGSKSTGDAPAEPIN